MVEKIRIKSFGKWTLKQWFTYTIFAILIAIFGILGLGPVGSMSMSTGNGVAAMVNEVSIPISEYNRKVENLEQNAQMNQLPEDYRRKFQEQMKKRALEQLISEEVVYQAAEKYGIRAADGEVRDYILQIPAFQEGGHFEKTRYLDTLAANHLAPDDFERQIRKEIVIRKLQGLFLASAEPASVEVTDTKTLANQKVSIRFAEVKSSEKVKARHILVRIDDKRTDADAKKLIEDIKKQATVANFSELAKKYSDDPGSKAKGGELGEFERGRMVPEFENAAFSLKAGEISEPIKTNYGYHLILVDKKTGAQALDIPKLKEMAEKGDKKEIDQTLAKADIKWQDSGAFNLSSNSVPKLGESAGVMRAIVKNGERTGLIPQLIDAEGHYYLVDVTSWKKGGETTAEADNADRMLAYKKSSELINAWAIDAESKASIQRNNRIIQ